MKITAILLPTALLAGCSLDLGLGDGGSPGKLGRARFDYGCELLGDCGVADHQLADSGARHALTVTMNSGYAYSSIESSDPSVATLAMDPSEPHSIVDIVTGHPGTTDLVLLDTDGVTVDRATLTVEPTTTLTPGWSGRPNVVIDSSHHVKVTTLDAGGRVTIGSGSVKFDVSGALTGSSVFEFDDGIELLATAIGSGHVEAHVDNAIAALDVDVIPASAIDSVSASNQQVLDGPDYQISYDVVFATVTGPAYGGECEWAMSDSSVSVISQLPGSLEKAPLTTVTFGLERSGDFTATCTAGGAAPFVLHLSR